MRDVSLRKRRSSFCPRLTSAALVLYDAGKIEEINRRCMGMNFDLKAALPPQLMSRRDKAQVSEPLTERQDVFCKWAAKVGGVTPGVEAPKVAVELAFRVADSIGLQITRGASTATSAVPCPASNSIHRRISSE